VKLPTKPSTRYSELQHARVLIYSRSNGFGKTKLCSQIPNALFLCTEDGANFLDVASVRLNSWQDFRAVVAELEKPGHGFETVVIDTIDRLVRLKEDDWCKQNAPNTPKSNYHEGCDIIERQFDRGLDHLGRLPNLGIWLIGNSVDASKGDEPTHYDLKMPRNHAKCRNTVRDFADIILFGEVRPNGSRVLYANQRGPFHAKDRTDRLPDAIELPDKNKNFEAIRNAFYEHTKHDHSDRKATAPTKGKRGNARQRQNVAPGKVHGRDSGAEDEQSRGPVQRAGVLDVQSVG